MKLSKSAIIIIIFSTIAVIAVGFSMNSYYSFIHSSITNSGYVTLHEIAVLQEQKVSNKITSDLDSFKASADIISSFNNDTEFIKTYIDQLEATSHLGNIMATDIDGNGVNDSGDSVTLPQNVNVEEAIEKGFFIGEKHTSIILGVEVVDLVVPIILEKEVVGFLFAEYILSDLSEYISTAFDNNAYAYIADENGDVVASADNNQSIGNENIFYIFDNSYAETDISSKEIKADLANGNTGTITYNFLGVERVGEYIPIGYGDWFIFIVMSSDIFQDSIDAVNLEIMLYNIITYTAGFILVWIIIDMKKKSQKEIDTIANYDELTGLPNLNKAKELIEQLIKRKPENDYTIIKFDVANFKSINELFDFQTGNQVIVDIAKMSEFADNKSFFMARIGTDEFIMFANTDYFNDFDLKRVIYRKYLDEKLSYLGSHRFSFKYGIYNIQKQDLDANEIISKVNLAHNHAKMQKNVDICFYDDDFRKQLIRNGEISEQMHPALQNGEFKVFLQPKYVTTNKVLYGAEALVRWFRDGGEEIIFPGSFISLFESTGFIQLVDMYMLEETCKIIRNWIDEGLPVVPISVNFSRMHLGNENFVNEVNVITEKYNIPKKYIELELTESTIIDNEETLTSVFASLRSYGYKLSMDDFGSGYSSLGLLKNLDVDIIKMDRSFFVENSNYEKSRLVVKTVVDMAKRLDLITVAEGVETKEQVDFLKDIGCEIVQGFYFAVPMPAEDFTEKIIRDENLNYTQH